MRFKPMDPALARKLIAGEEDVITPLSRMDTELFQNAQCPACGHTGASKIIPPPKFDVVDGMAKLVKSPFSSSTPIVQGHARCLGCGVEYNPISGLIIRAEHPILTGV